MNILGRYIGRHVIVGSIIALFILVGIDLVFAFAAEVPDLGKGDYNLGESLFYVLLTAPRRAYDFMPMATIVGSLVMLGGLAGQSEFIAMRSSGVSTQQIAGSVLKSGVVLVVIAIILGEGIEPFSESYAQQMRSFAQTQSTALKSEHGIWIRDRKSFINVLQVHPNGELRGLDIYELDDDYRLKARMLAKRARFKDNIWTLYDITQIRFEQDELLMKSYEKADWNVLLSPELLSILPVKPEQLPIWRLITYMNYLRANDLDTESYEVAFWAKVTAPFAIPVMLFLSVPFVFSPLRSTGSGQRILIGIILGITYYLLSHLIGRTGEVYDFNPALSSILPAVVFLLAGWLGWRTVR